MSDQIDQTSEDQEQEQTEVTTAASEATTEPTSEPTSESVAETTATSMPAAPAPSTAPPVASFDNDDDDDDFDGDDEGDEDDSDDDGDDENVVEGPAEYVQREKSGRGRRIGGDVRPEDVDYKNIPLLSRFLDRRGRILSRRKTRVSAKVQRRIVVAIKRARHLALLPYTADQTRIIRSKRR
jgi:small subunit ribosomal protein S18